MNILKYKYKAHKLVNSLFYIAVFLVGFCTGFLTNKIDFNKVIGQFLMIEDVKAFTFYENENVRVDEEFIHNAFDEQFLSFDMGINAPYVQCFLKHKENSDVPQFFQCKFFSEESKNNLVLITNNSNAGYYSYTIPYGAYHIHWNYNETINNFEIAVANHITTDTTFTANYYKNIYNYIVKTNFDFSFASSSNNKKFNELNFDKYSLSYDDINELPNSDNYYDEDYIYSLFNEVMEKTGYNSNFQDFSNVLVTYTTRYQDFYFSSEEFTGSFSDFDTDGLYYLFRFDKTEKDIDVIFDDGSSSNGLYTGHDNNMASTSTNILNIKHYLNFDKYSLNLSYNEELFKNDPNFKEVCVNNFDKFSIISNQYSYIGDEDNGYKVFSSTDFIWFKNGLNGLKTKLYYTNNDNNVLYLDNSNVFPMYDDFYWLNSKEVIDNVFSSDSPISTHLRNQGYIDKYLYYNYSLHPFVILFDNSDNTHVFNIFWFENPTTLYISSSDNIHGGGGLRLEEDTDKSYSKKYCFYVKKDYDVIIHDINEWGDISTNTTILGGENVDFTTTENQSNAQDQGLFSVITTFSSRMSSTISFINTNIYNFYLSMPLLVRMFILSCFTIFFIKYLIDMIVR